MKLSNKAYDILKWICLICLPAAAWGYSALADVWGLPFSDQIPETINIIATVLGVLIGVSTYNYNKSQPDISEEEVE